MTNTGVGHSSIAVNHVIASLLMAFIIRIPSSCLFIMISILLLGFENQMERSMLFKGASVSFSGQ